MSKKRAIVSYEKLTPEQRRKLEKDFPDGYSSALTEIRTPSGETLEAIMWETEDIIYLVKLMKNKNILIEEDDDDNDMLDDTLDVKVDEDMDMDGDEDEEDEGPVDNDEDEDESDEE